ncbi:D-inositol 3-phosphate glycosyltransferase [Mycobacterium avium subsp. paratuberculosis]|nr:D-inositol 3-phosphate glycosyltransferase [Mycobacterium avium subsp. paratuberculosis]OVF03409.1 D-inositol 3-phosphate glycosyltransferase [Mycobacterium avium subsp. paratuberculosis]
MRHDDVFRLNEPRRVAVLAVHTSPLAQPGTGDAGGMNVYVLQTALHLARRGIEVEIFTRATASADPPVQRVAPGVLVRNVVAGPFEGLDKYDLPTQLCAFAAGVLRAEASHEPGYYDIVHSHYWLSGQVGWLARDRWAVPLVHTAHTLAAVKNAALAQGDSPEPPLRTVGEQQVVDEADRLIVNTDDEARQLISIHHADPARIDVVHPGVDLDVFRPGDRRAARAALGLPLDKDIVAFVGRIQPLKAPDIVLRAAAKLPGVRIVVAGGPSGTGLASPDGLARLADELGISARVTFLPPQSRPNLATLFQAANLVAVPSYSESFGLVALEAQACGTPVAAAAVGGLPVAVRDGVTGTLVAGHDVDHWADALAGLLRAPAPAAAAMSRAAAAHAATFSWDHTTDALLASYRRAIREYTTERRGGGRMSATVERVIEDTLQASGLTYSKHAGAHGGPSGLVVELPGERKLKTNTILSVGEHSVRVEAFVCRKPDENHEGVYRFLLKRNRRLYGVAYTLDNVGDIYLVGRMSLASVSGDEIDRVLGQVLEAVDSDFNTLLELGFRSSIQKEWEWRVSRGESLKNLQAFAHLIDDDEG